MLLAFAWGFNWIAAAVALREVSPWSLRFAGSGIGAATLFAAAVLTGHNLRVPRGEHVHVMIAGFFNVAAFQILSGFAQLSGATSRAIIITYSMPIWATVLSRFVLGERLNADRAGSRSRCASPALTILVWPLFADGFPPFVFYSLGCALSWAFATVYIKWVKVDDRAAGQRGLAIAVRISVHRRRHIRVRRLSASLAAARRDDSGDPVCRPVRRRARAFPVVVDRRPAADRSRRRSARCWCR